MYFLPLATLFQRFVYSQVKNGTKDRGRKAWGGHGETPITQRWTHPSSSRLASPSVHPPTPTNSANALLYPIQTAFGNKILCSQQIHIVSMSMLHCYGNMTNKVNRWQKTADENAAGTRSLT